MTDANNVLNGVTSVVFDLDGTLYDKRGLAQRIVARLWWALPLLVIDRMARGGWWRWLVAGRWYRRVYMPTMVQLIGATCPRREAVVALATEAHRRGLRTVLYSDYAAIDDKLAVLRIDPALFDLRIDSPSLGARKPSAEAAQRLMQIAEADPKSTLFIGDRDDTDGATARLLGAKFLQITDN
jgi:FMN phosphatase YigB (HAD superfamily)